MAARFAPSDGGIRRACVDVVHRHTVRDPYEALEIDRSASPEEIKAAFRRLAARHHPDKNPEDPEAHTRFQTINYAYQVLSDPEQRKKYDRFGGAAFARGAGTTVDFGDLDGMFGDLLGALGLRSGLRGALRHKLNLEFAEAALGCKRQISYESLDHCASCLGSGAAEAATFTACGSCQGKGRVRFREGVLPFSVERACARCFGRGRMPTRTCDSCRGRGLEKATRTLEVEVPPGVETGTTQVVEGAGNRARPGDPYGKLELHYEVAAHELFTRDGDDILCAAPISFVQAALGGEVVVPTLEGKIKLRIPPGTQSGTTLRVRGHGVRHRLRGGRGDQLVEVQIEVPSALSPKARALLEELGVELGEQVDPQQQSFVEKLKHLFE